MDDNSLCCISVPMTYPPGLGGQNDLSLQVCLPSIMLRIRIIHVPRGCVVQLSGSKPKKCIADT
jgi:hypothetical protein